MSNVNESVLNAEVESVEIPNEEVNTTKTTTLTIGQASGLAAAIAAVGYGVGKLIELGVKNVVIPVVKNFKEKRAAKKAEKAAKLSEGKEE